MATIDSVRVPSGAPQSFGAAPDHDTPAFAELRAWVEEIRELTQPDRVHWVDGSRAENDALLRTLVDEGKLIKLNPQWRPGSYLARSHPSDVARTESRTFISSNEEIDAGPTNNWADPTEMHAKMEGLFAGSMRGRTMYVVPFSMGAVGGPLSHIGVQITDSAYAVASIGIMTRVGADVTRLIAEGKPWVRTVHSVGAPLAPGEQDVEWPCNDEKYIVHFPDTLRDEGWLAEHMLLIRVIDPKGKAYHVAAAFPSACGKTNLAMLRPTIPGWSVQTLGDDISWIRPGEDGRLWAINPEAGFFGVAPGTGESTNVTAVETLWGNTIFTNVALRPDGDVWWEGLTDEPPAELIDWEGNPWTPASGRPAAHPNSRFTVSAAQCPQIADDWEEAVPLDVILFGGRRATNVPLVVEASDWTHGVFLGSTISSERTAAAEGTLGELRRDPFAMLPFCGYNMGDYFAHWLKVGKGLTQPPRIFQVNWFRRGADGRFLWPGFGDNARVIDWVIRRVSGQVEAVEAPIGLLPRISDLNLEGLDVPEQDLSELFEVNPEAWLAEASLTESFFDTFGDRLPAELRVELSALRNRLETAR